MQIKNKNINKLLYGALTIDDDKISINRLLLARVNNIFTSEFNLSHQMFCDKSLANMAAQLVDVAYAYEYWINFAKKHSETKYIVLALIYYLQDLITQYNQKADEIKYSQSNDEDNNNKNGSSNAKNDLPF